MLNIKFKTSDKYLFPEEMDLSKKVESEKN